MDDSEVHEEDTDTTKPGDAASRIPTRTNARESPTKALKNLDLKLIATLLGAILPSLFLFWQNCLLQRQLDLQVSLQNAAGLERWIKSVYSDELPAVKSYAMRALVAFGRERRHAEAEGARDIITGARTFLDLRSAPLAHIYLNHVDLRGSILIAADLNSANLTGCDLTGVLAFSAHFQKATLQNAKFNSARLVGANFQQAQLLGAQFIEAELHKADFTNASLSGADFSRANLRGANFANSYLGPIILKIPAGIGLTPGEKHYPGANLSGSLYDNTTLWPEGFDPKSAGAIVKIDEP